MKAACAVLVLAAVAVFVPRSPLAAASTGSPGAASTGAPKTVVSLTFDDSDANQYTQAFPILRDYKMHATFYAITGFVGVNAGFMTVPQLRKLANAGNEIAGHTVLHPDLTQLSTGEATREICDSRNTLLKWGLTVTDFAYPLAAHNPTVENIARQCGYNSARSDSDIHSPYGCLSGCPLADTIPPADPYAVGAPRSVQDTWTLSDIESLVTQAESVGGWMPIVFHNVCNNACDPFSVTPKTFRAFLAWLQKQPVSVETVRQVIGGPLGPRDLADPRRPLPGGRGELWPQPRRRGFPHHR